MVVGRLPRWMNAQRLCFPSRGWVVDSAFDAKRDAGLGWAGTASNANGVGDVTESSPRKVSSRCVLFGDFELDLYEQTLRKSGQTLKIPGKIYQAMMVLIESPGDLVTREQIRSRLWPRETNVNYDANVNTTVNKLRQLLGDTSEGSNFIQTVPRRGYSFIAPLRYADAPAVWASGDRKNSAITQNWFGSIGEALRSERARIWFTASVVTWVAAAILFAGMILWHSRHAQTATKSSGQIIERR